MDDSWKLFYYKIRVEIDIPAVSSSSFGIFRFFKRKIPQKFPKKGIFYGKLFPREVPDLLIKGKIAGRFHKQNPFIL